MFIQTKLAKTPNRALRAGMVGLSALALGLGAATAITTTANAAEVGFSITDSKLRQNGPTGPEIAAGSTISVGQSLYYTGTIEFSRDLTAGDTFRIPMSFDASEILVSTTSFALSYEGGGNFGECTYVPGPPAALDCVVDSRVRANTNDVSVWFTLSSRLLQNGERVDFGIEDWTFWFINRYNPGTGGGGTPTPAKFGKTGSVFAPSPTNPQGKTVWYLRFGDISDDLKQLSTITITDTLITGQRESTVPGLGDFNVTLLPHTYTDVENWKVICWNGNSGSHNNIPSGWTFDFNADMTSFSIELDPNNLGAPCALEAISLYYASAPVGPMLYNTPGQTDVFGYGNAVDVEGYKDEASSWATASGGSSTGLPSELVMFDIEKALVGDEAANIPAGTTFSVEVQVEGESTPRTITLPMNGDSRPSGPIADDLDITIREINLPQIDGIEWGTPTLAGTSVVDNGDGTFSIDPDGGQTIELVLTNTANTPVVPPTFGSLEVFKVVEGSAPEGAVYDFLVECGPQTHIGSAVAGESFRINNLIAGTECTVTEIEAHGAKAISYSADSVTITTDTNAEVTVTNTFDTPTPPNPPIRGGESDGGGGTGGGNPPVLSSTGFETNYPLLIAIATLIAAGGALLVARKKLQEN